jgi:hypothetical protein
MRALFLDLAAIVRAYRLNARFRVALAHYALLSGLIFLLGLRLGGYPVW